MPPDLAVLAAPPAPTFRPTRRIVGKEFHGDHAAVKFECGHVADLPADCLAAARCASCPPGVPAVREAVARAA